MSLWRRLVVGALVGAVLGFAGVLWSQRERDNCWVTERDAILGDRSEHATFPAGTWTWQRGPYVVPEVRIYLDGRSYRRCTSAREPRPTSVVAPNDVDADP